MENTIMNEVAQNNEVAPVIKQVAKHSTNGGVIVLAVTATVAAGYLIWKGAEKMKEVCDTKKAEKEAAAKEHDFYVPSTIE